MDTQPSPTLEKGKRRGRLLRLLKTGLMASVVIGAFGAVALRAGYARANDAALLFGEQLLSMDQTATGTIDSEAYRLSINLQPVSIASATTLLSQDQVLDYFQHACEEHAGKLDQRFASLRDTVHNLTPSEGAPGYGTVRGMRGSHGFVVCMAPDHALTQEEKFARVKDAAASGDWGKLGDVRYVATEKAGPGTHVVAAWTTGTLRLADMFPKSGDAPGRDWAHAPRPAGARRVMSSFAEGTTYGVNVYEADGAPEVVREGVKRGLESEGWKFLETPKLVPQLGDAYSVGGDDLVVTVHESRKGKSAVSYVYSTMPKMVTQ
jgi:hypothetical protein